MSIPSVLQIPFIFTAAGLHHKAFTAPNPPTTEKRNFRGPVEKTLFRSITFVTVGQKAIVWTLGAAEAGILAAKMWPHWKYSRTLISHLIIGGNGDPEQIHMTLPSFVGLGLIVSGGLLRWSCYRTLGKMFTYEVSMQKEHHLVTSGPYAIVRHPAYSGVLMIVAGIFLWQGVPGSWVRESGILETWSGKILAVASSVWIGTLGYGGFLRTRTEDGLLAAHFGEEWKNWAKQVPYLLFPFIY